MRAETFNWKRQWLLPIVLLSSLPIIIFAAAYALDHRAAGGAGQAWQRYFALDPGSLTDAISQLAPVVVAQLGIVVTVVAIIVQLASNRYSGVARMFVRDRINLLVMAYYVVVAVGGVWLSVSLKEDFVPQVALLGTMAAASFGLVLMPSYFAYVFWFLEPANLVARIRRGANRAIDSAATAASEAKVDELQQRTLRSLAELSDICGHSISGKDKIIASQAVDALRDFALHYLEVKASVPERWFTIGPGIARNPDFVSMDPESLSSLERQRTWVEWQVLRQYMGIYNEALASMRDIDYLIAIDTRYLGEDASEQRDDEVVRLTLRFFNSFLRSTLNARDVRTAYNILNQYRLLVHTLLRHERGEFALEGARYLGYYGHVSFDLTLNFVTETIAYDLAALCQAAHETDSPQHEAMMQVFLKLDQPLRIKTQERGLLGVRKAQAKLAAYYLSVGAAEHARTIALDMRSEQGERLQIIRGELERVDDKEFWEITDRGRVFEYMPPKQKAALADFFELLAEVQRAD